MRKGHGLFFADCEDKEPRNCNICNTKMDIEDYNGFTSWAGAMAHDNHHCNRFICPNIKKDWHEQASQILVEAENTQSPSLKRMLMEDIKDIVKIGLRKE